jgi:hypothetical protein
MKVCIVSHDAGGAENVAAYLAAQNEMETLFVLAGPAIKVFERRMGDIKIADLEEAIAACDWCLCGTGWQSDLEWKAIASAHKAGKRTIAFLDHWVNYRERFTRNGQEVLPDEIWVADEYAKKMAEQIFPDLIIKQQQDWRLEMLNSEIKSLEIEQPAHGFTHILYVLEPIREAWGLLEKPGEFMALDYFIEHKDRLDLCADLLIRIRPHPSDPAEKYDQWIDCHGDSNISITVDSCSSLAESIAWSDIVVGCQTYAMVIALAAGKQVVSSIPDWAPPCVLPQPEIIRLADLAV